MATTSCLHGAAYRQPSRAGFALAAVLAVPRCAALKTLPGVMCAQPAFLGREQLAAVPCTSLCLARCKPPSTPAPPPAPRLPAAAPGPPLHQALLHPLPRGAGGLRRRVPVPGLRAVCQAGEPAAQGPGLRMEGGGGTPCGCLPKGDRVPGAGARKNWCRVRSPGAEGACCPA